MILLHLILLSHSCGQINPTQVFVLFILHYQERSDLGKHLTIKSCDRIFLKSILRFKKLKS